MSSKHAVILPAKPKFKIISPKPAGKKQHKSEIQFFKKLAKFEQIIILSPHLDDAILSMGSLLTDLVMLGKKITVISVFTEGSEAKSEFSSMLVKQSNLETIQEYFKVRKEEDKKALKSFGLLKVEHLGFIDAAWRVNNKKQLLYPNTIKGEVLLDDTNIIRSLESKLKKIKNITSENTIIFAPLARGRHVDHQIVRNVVNKISQNVIFYSDFPYSAQFKNEDLFITENNLSFIEWHGDHEKKMQAIAIYESQFGSFVKRKRFQLVYESFYFKPF